MKKTTTQITAILLAASMLVACGGGQSSQKQETTTAAATTKAAETTSANTEAATSATTAAAKEQETEVSNEDPYRITEEPITLKIGYQADASQGDWNKVEWWQKLSEASGITFEFVEYSDANAVGLMYASRDYPDIIVRGGSDTQIVDAVEAGDVYMLDDYIKDYAPNWDKYLSENSDRKAQITFPDGHLYSLPLIFDDPIAQLRDGWWINKNWLDQVGMDVPTTTDEFYEVLKAFKEHAGEGDIPADVIPYYTYGITNHVGGALDLINSFGVRVVAEGSRVTVDDNGKVEFNYANEAIKEPMKFIHKLVEEGLLSKDGFAEDMATYLSKTVSSSREWVGCYHSYGANGITYSEVPMGPLDSGNGKPSYIRSQISTINRNRFIIFKNCKYPEIAMKLANLIADPYWSVYDFRSWIEVNEDGTYTMFDAPSGYDGPVKTPNTYVPVLITEELASKIDYSQCGLSLRAEAIDTLYKDHLIDRKNLYPDFMMGAENLDRISQLRTDINNYVTRTLSDWALNGGIDEGWNGYIEQLNAYGLDEFLSLLQEEYDNYMSRIQ